MDENEFVKKMSIDLYQAKGWLKLLGILNIVYGVISIFSLWGILIGWLPIWMGILLIKAGNEIEAAQLTGEPMHMEVSLAKLKTYFTIQGVMAILGLIVIGIGAIVLLSTGSALLNLFR